MDKPKQEPHWTFHAKQWKHIGPPLRPCSEDLEYLADRTRAFARESGSDAAIRTLLLGVTQEIANLDWPVPVELTAVDRSEAMIEHVWPGDGPGRRALLGDWLDLPLEAGSIDFAIGDGCFTIFDFPASYLAFASSIRRALRPGGWFSIRLYERPEQRESVDRVFSDLFAGKIGNFHAFKWRLAMALVDESSESVALSRIWDVYAEHVLDPEALAKQTGFPLDEILTMNAYRVASACYSYPTVAKVVSLLAEDFELVEEWRGSYELAERCPQLLLRRR